MTEVEDIFELLFTSLHPEGALRGLVKLNDEKHRRNNLLELSDFYRFFDVDAFSIWDLLSAFPRHSLPVSVLPLAHVVLAKLEAVIQNVPPYCFRFVVSRTLSPRQAEDGTHPVLQPLNAPYRKLLAFNSRFNSKRGEALDAAQYWIHFGDKESRNSILHVMGDCIRALEEAQYQEGGSNLQHFDPPSSAPRQDPNYDAWTPATSMFKTLSAARSCPLCKGSSIKLALATRRKLKSLNGDLKFDVLFASNDAGNKWHEAMVEVLAPPT